MIRATRTPEQGSPRWCPRGLTGVILARFAKRTPTMRVIPATLGLWLLLLGGCGQMGPLYMPPETADQTRDPVAGTPAAGMPATGSPAAATPAATDTSVEEPTAPTEASGMPEDT
jgi:predicted small lipoprotein YifL